MARQLFTRGFWADAVERSIKTAAYSIMGALPVGAATSEIHHLPWTAALAVGGSAAVWSILGSIASLKVGNSGTASLTKAVEPSGT